MATTCGLRYTVWEELKAKAKKALEDDEKSAFTRCAK
jgi:hypothetical protein